MLLSRVNLQSRLRYRGDESLGSRISRARRTTGPALRGSTPIDAKAKLENSCAARLMIEILAQQSAYIVRLSNSTGYLKSWKCGLSPLDLLEEYKAICGHAEAFLSKVEPSAYNLAFAGFQFYRSIFPNREIRDFIHRTLDESVELPLIIVHSEQASIPWSFMYIDEPSTEKVDVSLFLGFNCIISCNIIDPEQASSPPSPYIHGNVEFLGGFCDTLRWARDFEIPVLKKFAEKTQTRAHFLDFPVLKPTDVGRASGQENKKARRALFDLAPKVVHLACHGSNHADLERNFIRLRTLYPLNSRSLNGGDNDKFKQNPLVFLNICEMGFIDPQKFSSIVRVFLHAGARTVIAPDCRVDDRSAAHFSLSFYKALLRGQPFMHALFGARLDALEQRNDFIGLAYCLYGQPHAAF